MEDGTLVDSERLMQIRLFDRREDAEMVRGWWEGHGQTPIEECMWTEFGVVATADDEDVACGWLYLNNRSSVAHVENLIVNPASEAKDAGRGLEMVVEFFRLQAEELGKAFEVNTPFARHDEALALMRGDEFIDRVEAELVKLGEDDFQITHRFTPGLYVRQLFIPAMSMMTSKLHKTTHPYVISKGDVSVWTKEGGAVRLRAPHTGITTPGTRRIIFAHEDTIWTTFHPTEETDLEKIEEFVIEKRTNSLLEEARACLGE